MVNGKGEIMNNDNKSRSCKCINEILSVICLLQENVCQDNSLDSRNEKLKINDLEKDDTNNNNEANNSLDKKESLRKWIL